MPAGACSSALVAGPPSPLYPHFFGVTPAKMEMSRSEEHTSELQSLRHLVCRLLLEKKKAQIITRFFREFQPEISTKKPLWAPKFPDFLPTFCSYLQPFASPPFF